jgi:hypothetical protein
MKKLAFLAALLISCIGLQAQEYYINLHQSGQVVFQNNVNEIINLYFHGSAPTSLYINSNTGINSFPVTSFDSITFVLQEPPQPGDAVTITYNDNSATIDNPYVNDGVSVTSNGADIIVNSTKVGISYLVTGNSSNGSLTINSNSSFELTLSMLSLTSGSTAAINIPTNNNVTLLLNGSNSLTDNAYSSAKAALCAAGNLTINGNGTLTVTGNAKHGINVDGTLTVNGGNIEVVQTDSDAIHCNSNLNWNGGTLHVTQAGSDALDISGNVNIQGGDLTLNTSAEGARGIKVSGIFTMDNGELDITCTGLDSKGIKADSLLFISGGTIGINHSGDISKGIKCDQDITINGGNFEIYSSGSTVVTNNDPAYCSAIKGDADIIISGGNITINLPTSNHGGKGISCAGNMTISGNNTINIETHGDGASYSASSGTDTYSSSCLRAEGNMQILSGNITLSSTGKGGKGIKVGTKTGNTYTGTYTQGSSDGTGPTLTISTTGTQIVSGGGGGWPPPGGGSASGSAKAIKVGGVATVYGGTTTVTTTQKGAEGLESKTQINIEGGQHYFKCYDDCINSSGKIFFNGGVTVCFSNGNDAVDSNAGTAGAITIGNGVAFAYTTRGNPEEGFDCDNNNYIRITGTGIGISAGGSQGGGGWPPGGGGSGGTITNPAQGYVFYTTSYSFQTGKYYTLSNTSGSGGNNMVTFSFEANCNSNLALITATGMTSGSTYYVKYSSDAPTNPTTSFHGLYLGGTSSASTQAFYFTAQ